MAWTQLRWFLTFLRSVSWTSACPSESAVTVAWVPGANELPQALKRLADKGKFDALIALGAVVQGSTPHAQLINSQVSRSLAQIGTDSGVQRCHSPVHSAVDKPRVPVQQCAHLLHVTNLDGIVNRRSGEGG